MTAATTQKTVQIKNYIGGKAASALGGETFETLNPATNKVLGQVALGGAEDVEMAAQAAKEAFDKGPWRRMSVAERAEVISKIGDLILERKEELATAESLDTGKPISESLTGDIPRSALNFHFFAKFAASQGDELFSNSINGTDERHLAIREPLGVCGLITPWNLPLYLATWKLAPALVMGNSCILKPAEWTPYTAFLFSEIASQAGLPPGVFNLVNGFGPGSAGEALTLNKAVASISFTGETTTGKAIMKNCAQSLKKVSFELGGKGASIIFDDADIDTAIETSLRAAYRNQGQICLAGSRLFVQEDSFKKVRDAMKAKVEAIRVGDPLDSNTEMGALVSKEHLEKVQSYVELGKKEGKLITGGERIKELGEGNFLRPALFEGLPYDSRLCQEEIFGPVLPIIPFKTEEEVLAMVNSTDYGLSTSIWTENVNRAHRVSRDLEVGLVWVNCWFARDLRTPFGGQKSSGIGREGGNHSLDFFSETKTISYRYK